MRVTVGLAETLVEVQDLVGPVAEAAQEWLEAREDDDRELISEARAELDLALADSSELQCPGPPSGPSDGFQGGGVTVIRKRPGGSLLSSSVGHTDQLGRTQRWTEKSVAFPQPNPQAGAGESAVLSFADSSRSGFSTWEASYATLPPDPLPLRLLLNVIGKP